MSKRFRRRRLFGSVWDNVAPTAGTITAFALNATTITVVANGDATDNVGVVDYTLEYSIDQTNWFNLNMAWDGYVQQNAGRTVGITTYYRAKARDAAGNLSAFTTANAVTAAAGTVDVSDTFSTKAVGSVIAGQNTETGNITWGGDINWTVNASGEAVCNALNKRMTINPGVTNYAIDVKGVKIANNSLAIQRFNVLVRYVSDLAHMELQLRHMPSGVNEIMVIEYNDVGGVKTSMSNSTVVLDPARSFTNGRDFRISVANDNKCRIWEIDANGQTISGIAERIVGAQLTGSQAVVIMSGKGTDPDEVANQCSFSSIAFIDPVDTTPPNAATNFIADNVGVADPTRQVHITFTAGSDPESGIARYELINNSVSVMDASVVSGDIVTLPTSGTTYSLSIRAVNNTGLTTLSTPPVIYATTGTAPTWVPYSASMFNAGPQGSTLFSQRGAPVGDAFWTGTSDSQQDAIYDIGGGPNAPSGPVSGAFCGKMLATPPAVPNATAQSPPGTTSNWGGIIYQSDAGPAMQFVPGDESWHRMWAWIPSAFIFNTTATWLKWIRLGIEPSPQGQLDWMILNGGTGTLLSNAEITEYQVPQNANFVHQSQTNVPIPRNQWVAFEIYNRWHYDPTIAVTRCYINKVKVHDTSVSHFNDYINLLNSSSYADAFSFCTNYNPPGLADTTPVWLDDIKIGKNSTPPELDSTGTYPIIGYS